MRPDASDHRPDPVYLRRLIAQTGHSQREIADTIGISLRSLQGYLRAQHQMPYPVQYCIERLAAFTLMTNTDGRDFQGGA